MEEKVHRYKLLQQFYPELKTTAERVKTYRKEHHNDDPLNILTRPPEDPVLRAAFKPTDEKVQTMKEVDPKTGEVRTQKNFNLFRDVFPKMNCEKCGREKTMQFHPCGGCGGSKSGEDKTYWKCVKCGHQFFSKKGIIEWWKELTGGREFSHYIPDGHGFIPKITLDPDKSGGGGNID